MHMAPPRPSFLWDPDDDSESDEVHTVFPVLAPAPFQRLGVSNDLIERGADWQTVATRVLQHPEPFLKQVQATWDQYNVNRGDTFGQPVAIHLNAIDPLSVTIHNEAVYANGMPCTFSVTMSETQVTDSFVGH
jgi:hypothetical protein